MPRRRSGAFNRTGWQTAIHRGYAVRHPEAAMCTDSSAPMPYPVREIADSLW